MDSMTSRTVNPHNFFALRQLYAESTERCNGTPIALPWTLSAINHYVDLLDGLILSGGDDIDPQLYGETTLHPTVSLVPKARTDFEWAMLGGMMAAGKPVLGICGGMQLLNVWAGGTLYQDVSLHPGGANTHSLNRGMIFSHPARLDQNSWLYQMVNQENIYVHSYHHQVVRDVAPSFKAVAWSKDGVIEAIESRTQPYVLGLQWHPEYNGQYDDIWIKAWIEGCKPH